MKDNKPIEAVLIKQERLRREMSQRLLAKRAGCTHTWIQKVELGGHRDGRPLGGTTRVYVPLAIALGLSGADIDHWARSRRSLTDANRISLYHLAQAVDEEREKRERMKAASGEVQDPTHLSLEQLAPLLRHLYECSTPQIFEGALSYLGFSVSKIQPLGIKADEGH